MSDKEAVREMSFEEEATLYEKEAREFFATEDPCCEAPPISALAISALVRRGMRIIRKAREEIETAGASLRPKGEWVEYDCYVCNSDGEPATRRGSVYVCSECGREVRFKEPFCHCGADMRGTDNG